MYAYTRSRQFCEYSTTKLFSVYFLEIFKAWKFDMGFLGVLLQAAVTFNLPLTNERLLLIKFCLKLNLTTFSQTFCKPWFCRRQHKVQHNILIPLVMSSDSRSVKSDPWLSLKSLNVNCCFNSVNYFLNEWHGIWCSLGGMPFRKTHQQKLSGGESFLMYIRRISISTNS